VVSGDDLAIGSSGNGGGGFDLRAAAALIRGRYEVTFVPFTDIYTPEITARIKALAGARTVREIAREVGLTHDQVRGWGRRNGVAFAKPSTGVSRYVALRDHASQRLGLRLKWKQGRISIWTAVAENLTIEQATRLLRHGARRELRDMESVAWKRGHAKLHNGNGDAPWDANLDDDGAPCNPLGAAVPTPQGVALFVIVPDRGDIARARGPRLAGCI
jgi:hypothetical protein